MNRTDAKLIAQTVTKQELKQMFLNFQNSNPDWEARAVVNKSLSKAAAFNILSANIDNFDSIKRTLNIAVVNMVREFGEFLPGYEKKIRQKVQLPKPIYHEPKLLK